MMELDGNIVGLDFTPLLLRYWLALSGGFDVVDTYMHGTGNGKSL